MKGRTDYFDSEYNTAQSDKVGVVSEVNEIDISSHERVPANGKANSVTIVRKKGRVIGERYYDENGDVYLDIDYTDHNNPKTHPVVPHQHRWYKNIDGNLIRGSWEDITK